MVSKQITRFLVSIRKSCIVYLEKYVVPIGQGLMDFHLLVMEKSWKSHGKYFFGKEWSPCLPR